jgi:hypothetical protein
LAFALAHAEQASLHDLERIGLQVDQNEEQPIFRRRQGAVLIDDKLADGPGFPIEAPHRHMRVERGLEGWHQLLKLVKGQAREIQELCGAGLHISEPYTGHTWCLLSWEAQHTITGINSKRLCSSSTAFTNRENPLMSGIKSKPLFSISFFLQFLHRTLLQVILKWPLKRLPHHILSLESATSPEGADDE